MAKPKKEVTQEVPKEVVDKIVKKVKAEIMPECPYCKSDAVKKVKKTEKGGLYSCGCGNRFQV